MYERLHVKVKVEPRLYFYHSDLAKNSTGMFQPHFKQCSLPLLSSASFSFPYNELLHIDLPISTSSDKLSSLHPQYHFCMVFRSNCGCIHFARCKCNSRFYPLVSSILLYFSFMFADYMCYLVDSQKKG